QGQANAYGHAASFKGYIGPGPYTINTEITASGGNSVGGPCPPGPGTLKVPLISGVHQASGGNNQFVIIGFVVVNVPACGNPTLGTVVDVQQDPQNVFQPSPTPTPTQTPAATATATATTTATTTPTT